MGITRTRQTLTLTPADKYRRYSKKPSRFIFELKLARWAGKDL
jgi:hypothetical protein